MIHRLLITAAALLLFTATGAAHADEAPAATPPLTTEVVLNAPVRAVWEAYTTREGQEGWNVAHAEVDLRIGGALRTHYARDGKIGDPNTIEHSILALDPERMLVTRITRFPEKFPFKNAVGPVWIVYYFTPVSEHQTRFTVRMLGFGPDEESRKMRAFFEKGNAFTMDELKKYVEKKAQ